MKSCGSRQLTRSTIIVCFDDFQKCEGSSEQLPQNMIRVMIHVNHNVPQDRNIVFINHGYQSAIHPYCIGLLCCGKPLDGSAVLI